MPNRHAVGHRDENEPAIIAVLDNYHIDYIKLREGDGADLLVFVSPLALVEVKNPAQKPSARRLTPLEVYRQTLCQLHGIPYHVVETAEQMAEIVGNCLRGEK